MDKNQTYQLPEGIIAGSFASMFKQYATVCHDFFRKYNFLDDLLAKLNNSDGLFLYVPAGVKPSEPIIIANLVDGRNDVMIHSRNLVMMEAESAVNLLFSDFSCLGESCIYNIDTVIALGEEAHLEIVHLQKLNNSIRMNTNTTVQQAAYSRMKTHYITISGNAVHNSLKVTLGGPKAGHVAAGLSLMQQTEHVDNDILMIHASTDCQSNQLFKNILSDISTGVFTGRIVVNRDAQKTTAYQRSANILLHPKAKMDMRPHLEIYADDVKCSHGATVGQLDAEALFYLRSRGIDESEAKKMLLHAFASEVVDGISCESIREIILKEMN